MTGTRIRLGGIGLASLVLLWNAVPAKAQTCTILTEEFPFSWPTTFSSGSYSVEWCAAGASISSAQWCPGGTALRMSGSSQDTMIWANVANQGCTLVTIEFDYSQFASTGTTLRFSATNDSSINCAESMTGVAGFLGTTGGQCVHVSHSVDVTGLASVYWQFDYGSGSNAIYIDNLTISLTTCSCDGGGGDHECCSTGSAGCNDPVVESCVCAVDAFCCQTEWDDQCVAEVTSLGCDDCAGGGACLTDFNADFGTFFQGGAVCSLFPSLFETCSGNGPYHSSGTDCGTAGDMVMTFGTGFPYSTAITKCFDLSGAAAAHLEFSYTKQSGTLGPNLLASTDGVNFVNVWSAPFTFGGGCSTACVDLSLYAGAPQVYVGFESGTSSSQAHGIDDVLLVLGSSCPACAAPWVDAGPDRTICPGQLITLPASAGGGAGGDCPSDYTPNWTGPGIVSGANTLSPTVNVPGVYVLSVACENCPVSDSVTVAPTSGLDVDAGPTRSSPCDGSAVQLAGSVSGCSGSLLVNWIPAGSGVILAGQGTLTPDVVGPDRYTLEASCDGGCALTDNVVVTLLLDGDVDGDGDVQLDDLASQVGYLAGPNLAPAGGFECGDLDMDGDVDVADFAGLANAFGSTTVLAGACCNPEGTCAETTASACIAAGGSYHGDGDECSAVACPSGRYSNEIASITSYFNPGLDVAMADDMTLEGVGARTLSRIDLAVFGGGGGVFDVTVVLYDSCPGDGGVAIAASTTTWTNLPDDGFVYVLGSDYGGSAVTLPDTVWMVATFSTHLAGWVTAEQAETGFTNDVFGQDSAPWVCGSFFDGGPYSGFWANIECVE